MWSIDSANRELKRLRALESRGDLLGDQALSDLARIKKNEILELYQHLRFQPAQVIYLLEV